MRKPPLDDTARAEAPGDFLRLSEGWVHHELAGPEGAPVVLLVHGFAAPSFSWSPFLPALHGVGLRTLRLDLYGRGWSDRPVLRYTRELFDTQLVELCDALGLGQVGLLGWSMGGLVSATFAERHPERVRALSMIAPAGLPLGRGVPTAALSLPGVGEAFAFLLGEWVVRSNLSKMFHDPSHVPWFIENFQQQTRYRGYLRALLSTMRHTPLDNIEPTYAVLGRSALPVQVLWGKDDHICPCANHQRLVELIPQATVHTFAHTGHAVHIERPEACAELLAGFHAGGR